MTKIIKHRKLHGLESPAPCFVGIDRGHVALSSLLATNNGDKLFLCGPLDKMTREMMMEPLQNGWEIEGEYVFKHRTAVYYNRTPPTKRVTVKLVSHRESWFPGCEDAMTAFHAWQALAGEWPKNVPILSSPAATGRALLWETLPCDRDGKAVEFPSLPDDIARLIRANSPQHRMEIFNNVAHLDWFKAGADESKLFGYDGRWMYAAFCGLDRFPIGAPRRSPAFVPYTPGIYDVTIRIPQSWAHIGLIPKLEDNGNIHTRAWAYPSEPGRIFRTWAFEPELTFALEGVKKLGLPAWEICDFHDGWEFGKGRPLALWSEKLIAMRESLQDAARDFFYSPEDKTGELNHFDYAAAAVRQILNHTIGAMHKNEYEREQFISDDNFRQWRREHPDLAESETRTPEKVEGGYLVPCFVPDTSAFSIFMPHWSASLYSLARARVAEWALKCDPSTLVKIHGDAIYSTVAQPKLDELNTGRIGQPRRKA